MSQNPVRRWCLRVSGFFSPRMRGQPAAAVSLPLPEDRLLCVMQTGVQELRSRYQEVIARSRLLLSPARLPCWHCVFLRAVRAADQTTHQLDYQVFLTSDALLFVYFYHRMTSAVISTMMWLPGKWRKPSLRNLKVIWRHILIWPRRCTWWPITTSYK